MGRHLTDALMSAPGPQSQDRIDLIEADRSRGLSMVDVKNVALVHGGFVDGSGWEAVYHLLKRDGFDVRIVQNPTVSLEGDVAATEQVLDQLGGPTVLVGHSYGGVVI